MCLGEGRFALRGTRGVYAPSESGSVVEGGCTDGKKGLLHCSKQEQRGERALFLVTPLSPVPV